MLLLPLHSGGTDVVIAIRGHLRGTRTGVDAAATAVEADAIHFAVVGHCAVIDVVNVVNVDVADAAIVEKVTAAPVAAFEAETAVTETVINSAIEADVRTPVTGVPEISAVAPAPITGSPEKSDARRDDPSAGNPEIAVGAIGPISGRPNISIARANRLRIDGQRRRSDGDGDPEAESGRGGRRSDGNGQENESEKQNA